ncbi:tail length tape measure protein [uncultured Haemophilus sp.]|uniref:tail length tape measure protein n=1 Tax=uncultured Haemophilus sp. TaxID=237779 RepID=UPI00258D1E5B|nr:tail length tape measure protein [uncultured Haemophilus sp.]
MQVGEIHFEVDMDTSKLMEATGKVDQAMESVEKSTKKAEKGFKNVENQVNKTTQAIRNSTGDMGKFGSVLKRLGIAVADGNLDVKELATAIGGLGFAFGGLAGVAVAAGSAIVANFISRLSSSKSEVDNLKSALNDLDKVIKFSESGVAGLSNEYAFLAKSNSALAQNLKQAAINEFTFKVRNAKDAITEIAKEQSSWFTGAAGGQVSVENMGKSLANLKITTDDYNTALKQTGYASDEMGRMISSNITATVTHLSKEFAISADEAFKFGKKLAEAGENPTPERVNELITYLNTLKGSTNEGEKALGEFRNKLIDSATTIAKVTEYLKELKGEMGALASAAQNSNFESMKRSLEQQKIALTQGAAAAKQYAIEHANLNDEQKEILVAMSNENTKLEEQKRAREKAGKAAESAGKKAVNAQKQVAEQVAKLEEQYRVAQARQQGFNIEAVKMEARMRLGAAATEAQKKKVEELAVAMYSLSTVAKNFAALQAQQSPVIALEQQYQQQMQQLEEYKTLYPQHIEEAEAVRSSIEDQYRKQRLDAQWDEWKQSSDGAKMFGDAVEAMAQGATGALAGIMSGTMSAREAFKSLANVVLNSVIGSIVEMGMAQVKSMIMGQMAAKTALSSQIAEASALTTAFTPAATMVSLATQGANAAGAQSAITSTAAVAKAAAITGRKNGGAVSANQMYRVAENGQPELYQAKNGMQYMIPGSSGRVYSNKDMRNSTGGPQGGVTVIVNQTNHFGESESSVGNEQSLAKQLSDQIRGAVRTELTAQMRSGGMLSR